MPPLPPPPPTLHTVTVVSHVARAIVQAKCYSGRDAGRLAERSDQNAAANQVRAQKNHR